MTLSSKDTATSTGATNYIERIKRLASTNKNLKEQFEELANRFSAIQEQNRNYQELLLKFSPEPEMGKSKEARKSARRLRMISILYVGISGFQDLYKSEDPIKMIDWLDELNLKIEEIAFQHNILTIKSLGDATLFATGLQGENRTNAIDIIQVALEMQHFVNSMREKDPSFIWSLKIAVHTGSVLAIPESKNHPTYSFSGENLTTAVRLGETADSSGITTSVMTYQLAKEFFEGSLIGKMPAKYMGTLNVYKIEGWIPEFKDVANPHIPNHAFSIKYEHIKFIDLEEEMLDYLEKHLPKNLYYHNVKHTIDVITEVELIGWAEGVSEEELLILKLAALFHDAGHTISYSNHEYHSTVMAREKMYSYDFPHEHIEEVCKLIMVTQLPPKPTTILEEIMCDSDLDYLGRTDFIPVSNNLYAELKEQNLVNSFNEWNKRQLKFIKEHQYFTKTALKLREVNKQKQIERLNQLIEEDNYG